MMIINILSACLTPVIAVVAAYIAYQQYLINKKNTQQQFELNRIKLNLDLYKMRFRIFTETKHILWQISKNAKIDIIVVRDYNFSINESKFLFEEDITQFINELQNKSIDLTHLTEELKDLISLPVNSNERNLKIKEWRTLIDYFSNEYQGIESKFMRYFDFRKI